jgi:plastocyanin
MSITRLSVSIAAICTAALLNACATGTGGSGGYGYGNNVPKEETAQEVVVTIKNFTFEPALITVAPGDTVVFVNEDTAPHTATAVAGTFDTGNLLSGASGNITVAEAGTFEYFCAIHPNMKGRIVVK